jgi:hypothetical protein
MAKNARKILGWKPTPKGNINLRARPFSMINGLGGTTDERETPVTITPEIVSIKNAQAENTMAQAQYFAVKNRLTA